MATLDDTALLEEVLDVLAARGVTFTRLRVGDIEVDGVPSALTSLSVSGANLSASGTSALPPADPGDRAVPGGRGAMYGSPSLWPKGSPPTFDSRGGNS